MKKKIAVVIPHKDNLELLKRCLVTITHQVLKPDLVIIVDNSSINRVPDMIQEIDSSISVHVIYLGYNSGFAYAVNQGIGYALDSNYEYVLLLNNDTRLDPECIAELVKSSSNYDESVGAFQPLILREDNPTIIDSTGISITRDMSAINRYQGCSVSSELIEPAEVFGPTGCAVVMRSNMLRIIKSQHGTWFDEKYFAYYEDVDLAWRMRYLGFSTRFIPQAVLFHVHSATGKSYSEFKSFHVHRNHWFTIIKNTPSQMVIEVVMRMVVRYFLFLTSIVTKRGPSHRLRKNTGSGSMVSTVLNSWKNVISQLSYLVVFRSTIKKTAVVSQEQVKGWIEQFSVPVSKTIFDEHG